MATHFSILAWRIPQSEQATVYGVTKSRTRLSTFTLGSRSGGVSPSNQVQLVSMLLSLILPYSGSFLILSSLSTYLFFSFQARFYWGTCCSREEQEQAAVPLTCSSLRKGDEVFFLYGVRTGLCPGVRLEGGLAVHPHFRWCRGQETSTVPCFLLVSLLTPFLSYPQV